MSRVLVEKLQVAELVLGANFRIGHGREGDLESLRNLGERFGFGGSIVVRSNLNGCQFALLEPHRLSIGDEQAEDLVRQFIFNLQTQARVLVPLGIQQTILRRQLQQITSRDFQLLQKLFTCGHRGTQIACIGRGDAEMLSHAD